MLKRRFVGSYEAKYYTEIQKLLLCFSMSISTKQKVYRIKFYIYTLNGNIFISLIDTNKKTINKNILCLIKGLRVLD